MFNWKQFTSMALTELAQRGITDTDLVAILNLPEPPQEACDTVGRLHPGSVRVRQHPDPVNFERVLAIRKDLAREEGYSDYIAYADGALSFLHERESNDQLFLIGIATERNTYEAFYVPSKQNIKIFPVGHLKGERQSHVEL